MVNARAHPPPAVPGPFGPHVGTPASRAPAGSAPVAPPLPRRHLRGCPPYGGAVAPPGPSARPVRTGAHGPLVRMAGCVRL